MNGDVQIGLAGLAQFSFKRLSAPKRQMPGAGWWMAVDTASDGRLFADENIGPAGTDVSMPRKQ